MSNPRAQLVRDTCEPHGDYWRAKHDAMDKLETFVSGDRYKRDSGAFELDRRLIQIRGQEIQDNLRHSVADATSKPRSVTPRRIGQDDNPDDDTDAGELVAALVERRLSDPYLGFEDEYEDVLYDSKATRLGVLWMDYEPENGPAAQIVFSRENPRRITWDPCYKSPHHPMCSWVRREKRIDVKRARKMFKAPWLQPDRDAITPNGSWDERIPLATGSSRIPRLGTDDKVTIWEMWWKHVDKEAKPKDEALAPEERYLACVSGCGYRSETQDEAMAELPTDVVQGCPTCGGDLTRIDEVPDTGGYSMEKTLVIMAPYSPSPEDKPLYDGEWPIDRARTFPALFLTAYSKGGDPVGPCDVDLMFDQQVASDNLKTMALQRVFEHRKIFIFPENGIQDFNGERFEMRDDQYNLAFRDNSMASLGSLDVETVDGMGLDPMFPQVMQIIDQALTRYVPKLDLGLGPDSSKNIAASTVAQLSQQAEVPNAHFARRRNRQLGMFYGVVSDYELALLTPDIAARFNIEGLDMLSRLHGDDIPGFDFVIEDTPEFTGLEKAAAEAWQGLMETYQTAVTMQLDPIVAIEVYADIVRLPKGVTRKFTKMLGDMMAAQQEQAAMAEEQAAMAAGGADSSMMGGAPPPDVAAQLQSAMSQ